MSKETLQLMEGLRQGLFPFRDKYRDVPFAEELMNWYNRDGVLVDTKRIDNVMPTTLFEAIPPTPVIEITEASWIQPRRDTYSAQYLPIGTVYAPGGVFFEGYNSTPHAKNATYEWDPGDGTGTVTGGFNFMHIYETPGNYTASLKITSGSASTTVYYPIIVGGPTGTTYYVDATAGSDSNDGLTTGTAWQTFNKAIDGMSSKRYNPGDRILFKRGETFLVNTGDFVSAHWKHGWGGYYFGAYGTGDKPIIKSNSTVRTALINNVSYGMHKISFVDIEFDGLSVISGLRTSIFNTSSYANNITFLRCDFHDHYCAIGGNSYGIFIKDCTFKDGLDDYPQFYSSGYRVGLTNVDISGSTNHGAYMSTVLVGVFRNVHFFDQLDYSRTTWRISKGRDIYITDCTIEGYITDAVHCNYQSCHFAPNTPEPKEITNMLFEYNTLRYGDNQINIGNMMDSVFRYNLFYEAKSLNSEVNPFGIGGYHGFDWYPCSNIEIYGNIFEVNEIGASSETVIYIRDDNCMTLGSGEKTGVARCLHPGISIHDNVFYLGTTNKAFACRWAPQRAGTIFTNNLIYKTSETNIAYFHNLGGSSSYNKTWTEFQAQFEGDMTGTTLDTGTYVRPTIESLYLEPEVAEEEVTIVGLPQLFHGNGIDVYCAGSTIYQAFVESEVGDEIGLYSSTYGAEEVSNGGFDSGTGWSGAAWTIAGGKATPNTTSGTLTQTSVVEDGKVYKVTVEIDQNDSAAGYIQVALGTAAGRKLQVGGKFHEIIKSNGTSLVISYASSCRLALDSISVKELPATTIEGNNRWEFAEFHNHFVLCNGIDLLYYIPGVGMVKLATGGISACVARNRLIIVGNDIAPTLSSGYEEPEDPYTRTSRAVWWSSLNFADAHNRLLSGFSDTAIDDYELLGNQLLMNTGGSINLKTTHDDTVLQVLPFQDGFIVYCKYSIWKFSEVNDPISTYRIEKLADFGIPARGFAGGRTLEHVFIGMQGRLWRLSEKMELLDYRYYLEEFLEKTVWIEWESTENLYYICHENGSFILTAEGLFESNHRPNSITLIGGISTDVGTAAWTCETPWLTFGTNTQKSVLQLLVKTDNPSVWNWEVQAKTNPGSTIEVVSGTFGSNGKALVGITGLELKVRLSTATYGKLESAQVVWSDTEGVFI